MNFETLDQLSMPVPPRFEGIERRKVARAPSGSASDADAGDESVVLIARARARDVDAIRRLYVACSPVYGYIQRRYKDTSFAKEIFQDTVTEIWKGSAPFNGKSKFSTWAIAIARHLAADALRKRGQVAMPDDENDEHDRHAVAPEPSPFEALVRRQERDSVTHCIRKLSPKLGEVLMLVYYAELPQAEIAGMLALNINTVKTRVRDAHAKVRSCLTQRMKELS